MQLNEIILSRKLYFDKCTKEFGDGFYPVYWNNNSRFGNHTIILFQLSQKYPTMWRQVNESVIYGLDDNTGIELLASLNREANVNVPCIVNSSGRRIYPTDLLNTTYRMMRYHRSRSLSL
jgi:hypothetical protein